MNIRRVGVNMISGGAGFLVPMAINVFSTPYVIKQLGEEGYGLQALANVIIGYLVVADMGLDIPITRKIAEFQATNDREGKSKFLAATIKIYVAIGLVGMTALLLFTEKLIDILSIPVDLLSDARTVFYLTAIGFLGSIVLAWGKAVFNGMQRYEISNGVGILNNLLGVIGGISLVAMGYGVIGFIFARVAGFILASIVFIILSSHYIERFQVVPIFVNDVWSYLKRQIGYGFSLRMSGMIFGKMDQTLISMWLGVAVLTVYAVPVMIAASVNGLIVSITHFAFPMASAMNATRPAGELESFFTKISTFIVAISSMIFIPLLVLGGNILTLWISPDMGRDGTAVLHILIFAFYINTCVATAVVAFVVGLGHLSRFTVYGVSRGVVLLIGFIVFIQLFGLEGAGVSYAFTLLLDIGFFIYGTKKILGFNPSSVFMKSYLKPMLLAAVLGGVLYYFHFAINTWTTLVLSSGAFCLLYILIGFKMNIFGQTEMNAVSSLLKRRKVEKK